MRKFITFHGCLIFTLILLLGSAETAAQKPFKSSHQLASNKLIYDKVKAPKSRLKDNKKKPPSRVITTQPEGTVKTYNRTGQYDYYASSGVVMCGQQDGNRMDIVYAEDGKVYLRNILCGSGVNYGNYWVEGTIEGNEIHVALGQEIYYSEYYDASILLAWGEAGIKEEDGYVYFTRDERVEEAVYVIDGQTISLLGSEGSTGGDCDVNEDYHGIGLTAYWSDDGSWTGFLEWNTVLTDLEPVVTPQVITDIPEGCTIYTYIRNSGYISNNNASGITNGTTSGKFNVAFDMRNNDVYIQNPAWKHHDLNSWVKGTYDGNTNIITVPTGQYLSWSDEYGYGIQLMWGSTYVYSQNNPETGEDDYHLGTELDERTTEIQFMIDGDNIYLLGTEGDINAEFPENYNATGLMTIYSDDQNWTSFEFANRDVSGLPEPMGYMVNLVPAVPANPTDLGFTDCGDESGYTKLEFILPSTDIDGNYLDPGYLSYSIWVDNGNGPELFVFDAETYSYDLTEDLTEIPYSIYNGGYDFYSYSCYFYRTNCGNNPLFINDIGIQVFYTINGEKHASDIVWLYNNGGQPPTGLDVPAPTASIPSGSIVFPGTRVYLNQDVPISVRYAIETAPFNDGNVSNLQWHYYDRQGIPIDQDMRIHAYAEEGDFRSGTVTFTYYTIDSIPGFFENVSFTVDKTDVCVGEYQTYRAQYKIKDEYLDKVSNMKLIVTLPQSCPFYENSVMIGDRVGNYTIDANQVTIPLEDASAIVRFCASPTTEGDYMARAILVFDYDDNHYGNNIGEVQYSAYEMSLRVPLLTRDPAIMVSGRATKGKSVKVYDGDVLIGQTNCLTNGSWSVRCNLYQPVSPSIHTIHAEVTTTDDLEFYTEYKDVEYRECSPQIDKIDMIYNGEYYIFDYLNGTVSPDSYSYNPSLHGFTFVAYLLETTSTVSNLRFMVLDTKWNVKTYNGYYDAANHRWTCSATYDNTSQLPTSVGLSYDYTWEGQTYHYETVFTNHTNGVTPNIIPCIDPSGFVYEAVPSNRLQGVKATCYFMDSTTGEAVLWDAAQYEQENPLFTDEQGFYRWDVPIGTWQVKYEKDGYLTTYSDWLPVPPPQLDVNIGMKQMGHPQVIKAHAYPQSVEFEFDKYMLPGTLTTDNITVSANGKTVNGQIELLNEESTGTGQSFASRVRFTASQPFNAAHITLKIKNDVESYAGVKMENDYEQTFNIEHEMQQIVVEEAITVPFQGNTRVMVSVLPAASAANKTLIVNSLSPMIADAGQQTYQLDANGQAVITVNGLLLGQTTLTFTVLDYDLTASSEVSVEIVEHALRGDVNGDGEVNIADVNALIDIILGGNVDAGTRARADVNGDDEVNIADVNTVIDIILNPMNIMSPQVNCNDMMHLDDMTIKPGDVRTLLVTVDHAARYSALQCDILLPQGLTLVGVDAMGMNTIRTGVLNDSTSRVLNFSMSKLPFAGDVLPVMAFTVKADATLAPESVIALKQVVLADADNKAWRINDCTARVNKASSGIDDMSANCDRIWVEKNTLCIQAGQDGTARIITVNGMVSDLNIKAGLSRHHLDAGIYVVVLNGRSYKIDVR